jgi:hypothetical protein
VKNRLREILYSVLQKHKPELLDWEVIEAKSPIELRVYDSQGNMTGILEGEVKEEIPYSLYGDQIKTVVIFWPSNHYHYEIIGIEEGTYGLTVTSIREGETATFTATDIPTSLGATHQYTIDWDALSGGEEGVTVMVDSDGDGVFEYTFTSGGELTHDEFVLQTETTIDFDPDTLNLKGKGEWVTVYIELPEGYNVTDVDVSTIRLNETIPAELEPTAIGDYDNDTIPDLMVKFNRTAVSEFIFSKGIKYGNVTLTITGWLNDGTIFEGSDVIKVRMPDDVNGDGEVGMSDIFQVIKAFGSYPGHPRWNPDADINNDGRVDMRDICLVIKNFGKTYI